MNLGSPHVPPRGLKDDAAAAAHLIEGRRFPEGYRRILLAAATAFSERGFHGTTTREIAAQVGMSPAALYVHFGSKKTCCSGSRLQHSTSLKT
jgi:AcrR family transcriptional regulator